MQRISVFDMLKIGVGPSSSHTMGPWKAAARFLADLQNSYPLDAIRQLTVHLYGSLAKTGRGHGTDIAILMGLLGEDPATCDTTQIDNTIEVIRSEKTINLMGQYRIPFDPEQQIVFHDRERLDYHPNGMIFQAVLEDHSEFERDYYSVGGGFVVEVGGLTERVEVMLPYPCDRSEELREHCHRENFAIWQMVWENEKTWRAPDEIRRDVLKIWETMAECAFRGCSTGGILPGGLGVVRRAADMHYRLTGGLHFRSREDWLAHLKARTYNFSEMVKWVSCFAMAVNEENAAFGRVVTAPTNGAAGVIPAVLLYYACNYEVGDDEIIRFLLVAGEIGSFFKKRATISAAQGGCQAEIGVSSSMAAAALTECLGGTVDQALMAAEIAMEHHLGLTCDPIRGLVQIPCIERNAMGAMKAITAANLALEGRPQDARVSLDVVIDTMWATALDMSDKYKETSEGGLALHIPVNVIEC